MLGMAIIAGGCGSSDSRTAIASQAAIEKAKQLRKERAEKDAQDARAVADAKAADKKTATAQAAEAVAAKAAAKPAPQPGAAPVPVAPAAPPPRPNNFADWTPGDYMSARTQRDPRLGDAIGYLGTVMEGSPVAAQILVSLLMRSDSLTAAPGRGESDPAIVRAAVRSLWTNGSAPARSTLEQLLLNEFPTSDDGAAFSEAVEALASKPTPAGEAILLNALKQPQAWPRTDPNARGPLPPGPRLLGALRSVASEQLRLALAQSVAGGKMPPAVAENIRGMFMEPVAANLSPQTVLYAGASMPDPAMQRLEEIFLVYSSEATRRMIASPDGQDDPGRVAPGPSNDLRRAASADPQLADRVSRLLWSGAGQVLCERLAGIESLERQGMTLALGLTVPRNNVRASAQQALRMNWQDGPKGLQAAINANGICLEPGAVIALKGVYRISSLSPKFGTTRRSTTHAIKNLMASKEEAARLNDAWARFTYQVVSGYCGLLNETATPVRLSDEGGRVVGGIGSGRSSVLARTTADSPKASTELPIELHPQARVVSRYDLRWPSENASRGAGQVDTTEMHYVRIQQTTPDPRALVNYYRTQLSTPAELLLDGGKRLWLDGRPRSADSRKKLSVDVILTRTKAGVGPAPDTEERLTVEVLSIEASVPGASD